jgi:glycosyltransferase involved in cell wall biosynthesis
MRAVRRAGKLALRANAVALIACHYPLYGLPLADFMRDIPSVIHFHGPWAAEAKVERNSVAARATKRLIEMLLYTGCADGFIVLSRAFGKVLQETYGISAKRIFVIPGGVDIRRFTTGIDRPAARTALGLPQGRPIVVTVRRLVYRMGLENLIDAVKAVARRIPDVLLVIAGSGPLRRHLENRIVALDLANNVHLLGDVRDDCLPLLYRAADASILPSATLEGFGLPAAESLACGTPAFVTPVGGLPEVVGDLSRDLILRGNDAPAIADGLRNFMTGRLTAPDTSTCSRYAQQRFDWRVIADRIAQAYTQILSMT